MITDLANSSLGRRLGCSHTAWLSPTPGLCGCGLRTVSLRGAVSSHCLSRQGRFLQRCLLVADWFETSPWPCTALHAGQERGAIHGIGASEKTNALSVFQRKPREMFPYAHPYSHASPSMMRAAALTHLYTVTPHLAPLPSCYSPTNAEFLCSSWGVYLAKDVKSVLGGHWKDVSSSW